MGFFKKLFGSSSSDLTKGESGYHYQKEETVETEVREPLAVNKENTVEQRKRCFSLVHCQMTGMLRMYARKWELPCALIMTRWRIVWPKATSSASV